MTLEVRKKERETSQSLLRRFQKSIRESGILLRARRTRFKKKPQSKLAKKEAALRRAEIKKEYEKLKKLGKIEERPS